jgi:glycosyltransferase involved in cell wall biosynthesis
MTGTEGRRTVSRISAIIPVRNRPRFLREAVESLVATGFPNLEVLIVDDGSEDDTLDRARELERRFPSVVRALRHADGGNHGPGASRNLGVRAAGGEYVCFLDSDDVVLPHRFRRAVPLMETDGTIDAVCEPFLIDDGHGPRSPEPVRDPGRFRLGSGGRWHTNTVLMRRRCFLDLGGFSERLRTCEDLVLWGKLNLTARIDTSGRRPVAVYRRHSGNESQVLENSLRAYLEVMDWANSRALEERERASLHEAVWGKALYVSDRLRRNGRPALALRMLLSAVKVHPAFASRRSLWKNLLRDAMDTGFGTWKHR